MMNVYDQEDFFASYARMERSSGLEMSGEWHQLRHLFPSLEGLTMLDLGCGYGWHSGWAVQNGAERVLGIDSSERMIGEAEKRFQCHNLEFRRQGIEDYEYPEEAWDLVFSNLALHYIENLDSVFTSVHRTLKKGGIFLFNIEHPVYTSGIRESLNTASAKVRLRGNQDFEEAGTSGFKEAPSFSRRAT